MPNWVRYLLFFVVVIGVTFGMHYYAWRRLVHDPAWPQTWRRVGSIAFIALGLFMVLGMVMRRALGIGGAAQWVAYVWLGVVILFVITFAFMDLGKALVRLVELVSGNRGQLLPTDPERRRFLARALAGVAGAAVAGTATYGMLAARRARVNAFEVALAKLPPALDGMKIVQVTDVHVGATMDKAFVEDMVGKINALEADVVAITGDLVDGTVDDLADAVSPLANIRATQGTFFVTGNHEFYSGPGAWRRELARLGIRVLSNQRVTVGRPGVSETIDLAGVEDPTGSPVNGAVKQALAGRDPTRECVLLAHQPKSIFEASRQDVGLQLSGHTHAGQIWPWKYFVYLQQPYVEGLHTRGRTQIYVSRGTGSWGPPMRVGAPPEITLVRLRAAKTA